jgi:catechol 2,3-dioxygenase-like lactoylglutathione lyase family enzyme
MKHIEDDAGSKGAGGMALMGCDIKHLAGLQNPRDAGDRELEGAAQQQGPLLVRVGVIGDDGARSDVNSTLGNVVGVDIAAVVARSDLTRRDGGEVKELSQGIVSGGDSGDPTVGLDRVHGLCHTRDMTIKRLDHVSVVVDDLPAAIAFFTALGMTIEGEAPVEGPWVDRVNGLESVQVDIVMMRTPDGHGRLELTKFRNPKLVEIEPAIAPPNTLGLRSVMFTVESVDDTVARLRANGAQLVGEVAQYEDKYRLCYMRGPAGIIVALAEELRTSAPR